MLNDTDFRSISLDDRDLFVGHYNRFPQVHSDNTFTNMICWNHYAHYCYAHVEGSIVLSSTIDGNTRYRPPIGPRDPELLEEVMALATKSKSSLPLVILDPETKKWISEIYPQLTFRPERNYFDYVYRAADLAGLPGRKYLTIRHQLNQFQRNCAWGVEPVTVDNLSEVFDFLEQWCEWKDCDSEPVLANEKEAVLFAILHYSDLKLSGLIIRVDGKIAAMAIFEGMNSDTALVHFEKGIPECKGIYRAINAETAKFLAENYTYINRESDMGVEGIREAKTRYHPDHMVKVYFVSKADLENIL